MRIYLKAIIITCIILVYVFILTCGNNEKKAPQELIFNVNQALLGETIADSTLGISFAPPKSCTPLSEEMVNTVTQRLVKEYAVSKSFPIRPHRMFLNEQSRFACLISILPTLTISDSSIIEYEQAIVDFSHNKQVNQDSYLYGGYKIHQSLIMDADIVQFKLVIPQPEKKSFQIDYVIPRKIYEEKVATIESSIGSLKRIERL